MSFVVASAMIEASCSLVYVLRVCNPQLSEASLVLSLVRLIAKVLRVHTRRFPKSARRGLWLG